MTQNNAKPRIWTKYFILICVSGLCTSIVAYLLDCTLSLFAVEAWDSTSAGGMLTTMFTLGSIVMTALVGSQLDKRGRRKIMFLGLLCYAVGVFMMIVFKSQIVCYIARIVQGCGKAISVVGMASMASDVLPVERMGEGMGYFGLGHTLAAAIGPSIGLAMASTGDFNLVFACCIALFAICAFFMFFVDYEKKQPELFKSSASIAKDPRYRGFWTMFERNALAGGIVEFFMGAGNAANLVYIPLYAKEQMGIENSSLFFIVAAGAMLLTRLFIGKIIDKRGCVGVCVSGAVTGILSYVFLVFFKESYIMFLLTGACYGYTMASSYPALQAAVIVDSAPERKGVANSTLMFGLDFGILVASAVLGWICESAGWLPMYAVASCFFLIAIVIVIFTLNNRARARRREKQGIVLHAEAE